MKQLTYLFVLACVAVLAAACGGSSEAQEPAGPQLVRESVLATDSFDYEPGSITVPAGSSVTISLENEGALEHSWVLVAGDLDPLAATETDAINGVTTGNIAGGETGRISFDAPDPGTYQFVCTVAGHAAGGMVGTFTVEE